MALINLQTNLKSLKFGKDRPGGGDSGQPYKTKSIDQKQSTTGGPDFLLRGGSLAPIRAFEDVSRLTKFFFDFKNPRGMLFIAKQNVLSRQNVQTEVSSKIAKKVKVKRTGYAFGALNQGVYLPTSTIAQAGVGFTGTHLNLFGIDPSDPMLKRGKQVNGLIPGLGLIAYEDFQGALQREGLVSGTEIIKKTKKVRHPYWSLRKKYPELWEQSNGFGEGTERRIEIEYDKILPGVTTNRLVGFYEEKQIQNTSKGGLTGTAVGNLLGIEGPEVLYKYPGGPGSVMGVGKTTIRFASSNLGGPLRTGMNNSFMVSNPDWFLGTIEQNTINLQNNTYDPKAPSQYGYLGASLGFWGDLQENKNNFRIWNESEKGQYNTYIHDLFINKIVSTANDNNAFKKNLKLTNKSFYDPLQGLPDKGTIVGPNNFTKFGIKPPITDGQKAFGYDGNLRGLAPMSGSYGFTDGASSTYGRSYALSGADNGRVNIAGINYANNFFDDRTDNSVYAGGGGEGFLMHSLVGVDTGLTFNQKELMNETSAGLNATIKESFVNKKYANDDNNMVTGMSIASFSPNYPKMRRENRLSYGDPGNNFKNRLDYGLAEDKLDGTNPTYLKAALDKITASPIYEKDGASHGRSNLFTEAEGGTLVHGRNDLAKFSIGIVQNNSTGNSWWMHFRAFIDSFSDGYTADWKDIQYSGRSEKFYNYGGFSREISLGWTVVAQSKAELIPMYRKLNYLASSLAGSYSDGGFMRGNLYYLHIGGYLYKQLGVITGLTYDVPSEATWEIGLKWDGTYDDSVKELPQMIKVTGVKFKPIHSFVPRIMDDPKNQGKTPFIALQAKTNNYP